MGSINYNLESAAAVLIVAGQALLMLLGLWKLGEIVCLLALLLRSFWR